MRSWKDLKPSGPSEALSNAVKSDNLSDNVFSRPSKDKLDFNALAKANPEMQRLIEERSKLEQKMDKLTSGAMGSFQTSQQAVRYPVIPLGERNAEISQWQAKRDALKAKAKKKVSIQKPRKDSRARKPASDTFATPSLPDMDQRLQAAREKKRALNKQAGSQALSPSRKKAQERITPKKAKAQRATRGPLSEIKPLPNLDNRPKKSKTAAVPFRALAPVRPLADIRALPDLDARLTHAAKNATKVAKKKAKEKAKAAALKAAKQSKVGKKVESWSEKRDKTRDKIKQARDFSRTLNQTLSMIPEDEAPLPALRKLSSDMESLPKKRKGKRKTWDKLSSKVRPKSATKANTPQPSPKDQKQKPAPSKKKNTDIYKKMEIQRQKALEQARAKRKEAINDERKRRNALDKMKARKKELLGRFA